MKSMDILWLAWLVFPIGAAMVLLSGRSRWSAIAGALLCLACIFHVARFWDAFVWQFDLIRGWSVELPVRAGDYQVVFTQRPSLDFYDTSFRIIRADGWAATLLIDGDAGKWRNPRVVSEGQKSWIIADNMPRERAPLIDASSETILVHGWIDGVFRLPELEYGEVKAASAAGDRAQ